MFKGCIISELIIEVKTTGAEKVPKLDNDLKKTEKTAAATQKTINLLGVAIASVVTIQSLRMLSNYADEWTQIDSKLKLVTTSTEHLHSTQQQMLALSNKTRQSTADTVTLYTRLTRATTSLNLTQKERLRLTETINKSLVVSGASAQESASVITQLSQSLASGVLRGEEFNSISENGSEIMQMLSKSLGVTIGELRAMSKEGKLTSEIVLKGLADGAEDIDEKFSKMAITIEQANTIFNNGAGSFVDNLNDMTGASDKFSKALVGIGKGLSSFDWDNFWGGVNKEEIYKNLSLPMEEYEINVNKSAKSTKKLVKLTKEQIKALEDLQDRAGQQWAESEQEDKDRANSIFDFKLTLLEEEMDFDQELRDEAYDDAVDKLKELNKISKSNSESLWNEYDSWFDSSETDTALDKFNKDLSQGLAHAFADALTSGDVSGAMQALSASFGQSLGSLASKSIGGIGGAMAGATIGAGISLAAAALFSSPDTEEQGQRAFDSFIDSVEDATRALEVMGNIGSSQAEEYEMIINRIAQIRASAGSSLAPDTVLITGKQRTEYDLLLDELDDYFEDFLGNSIDYAKMSTEKMDVLYDSIDLDKVAKQEQQLAELSQEFKESGRTMEQWKTDIIEIGKSADGTTQYLRDAEGNILRYGEVISGIITDPDYIAAQDYAEVINLITDAMEHTASLEDRLARTGASNEMILLLNRTAELADETDAYNISLLKEIYAKEDAIAAEAARARAYEDSLNKQSDALNSYLSDINSDLSSLENIFSSLGNVISSLRGDAIGAEYTLVQFNKSMALALSSGTSSNIEDAISKASVLSNQGAFTSSFDQKFAQLTAANQFERLEVQTQTEIDYLRQIEVNTRSQINALVGAVNSLGVSFSYTAPTAPQLTGRDSIYALGGTVAPSFDIGTPRVPRDMTAKIHKDEIIVPQNFSDGLRRGDLTMGNNKNLTKVMSEIKNELYDLKTLQIKLTANSDRQLSTQRGILDSNLNIEENIA